MQRKIISIHYAITLIPATNSPNTPWFETSIYLTSKAATKALIYNPINNKIYIAHVSQSAKQNQNRVSIIDGNSNKIIKNLQMPEGRGDFCSYTVNDRIYATNYTAGSITILNGNSYKTIGFIAIGNGPNVKPVDICYEPVNERTCTANHHTYCIGVIKDSLMNNAADEPHYSLDMPLIYPNPVQYLLYLKTDKPAYFIISDERGREISNELLRRTLNVGLAARHPSFSNKLYWQDSAIYIHKNTLTISTIVP